MADQRKWLYAAAGAATLLALISQRRRIALGVTVAWDSAKKLVLARALPRSARPYADYIVEAASAEGGPVFALVGLGDRESRWGALLTPPGPAGVGDLTDRRNEDGTPRRPPTYGKVPAWGYGLMQIDVESFLDFVKSGAWSDARQNIRKGASVLRKKMDYFMAIPGTPGVRLGPTAAARRGVKPGVYRDPRPLGAAAALRAALSAYNTGELNVLRSLAAGVAADTTSTGKDYGMDVERRGAAVATAFRAAGGTAEV